MARLTSLVAGGGLLPATRRALLARSAPCVRCCQGDSGASSSGSGPDPTSSSQGFARQSESRAVRFSKAPPRRRNLHTSSADALMQTLQGISANDGRINKLMGKEGKVPNNMVLGLGENTEDSWRELDQKVNEYPGLRTFKAIGTGGDEFVGSIVTAVAGVVGPVHPEHVQQRLSTKQNYISVTVGPVWVQDSGQVIAVYNAMREDKRLKWCL